MLKCIKIRLPVRDDQPSNTCSTLADRDGQNESREGGTAQGGGKGGGSPLLLHVPVQLIRAAQIKKPSHTCTSKPRARTSLRAASFSSPPLPAPSLWPTSSMPVRPPQLR